MVWFLLISVTVTAAGMRYFIKLLNNTKVLSKKENNEIIKKPCIKELHKSKANTPTMGGVVMNAILLVMTLVYYLVYSEILWISFFILLYGVMGFIDDYIKIKKIRDGVKPSEKLVGLIVISTAAVLLLTVSDQLNPELAIPFLDESISLNTVVYAVLMIFLLTVTTNSVNITDGLDGLALGISSIVLTFISITAWQKENTEVLYTALILLGTCLGALVFNRHPARIFIGDTGSLFLGGAMALLLMKLDIPLWIIIVLIVCMWEILTVIIQLLSLKFRKKKVFKIAPFHHHLEKCGWKETTIVFSAWLITGVFCIIGYIALGGLV